jgi:predicted ATPase
LYDSRHRRGGLLPIGRSTGQVIGSHMDHRIGFVRFAVASASAVADWHETHGVHGRLGPHALIVVGDGTVRLSEFRPTTQELAYLAPEQTGRLIRGLDERTDLYALGVVLYERLTGRLPFDALDALEWVHCHLARRPVPPAQLVPDIGPMLQQILLRLLAKQPEERYQTARGLAADLDRCRADLTATGQVTPFPLGQCDVPDRLVLTGRPYGRQRVLAALRAAFDRVSTGAKAELVCLAGDPGIGKSTLIAGLIEPIALAGGRFLAVRFDPHRPVPYAMITEPLAELAGQLLAESEERLARWRVRLNAALGSTAGALVDLVPALAEILGTQPPTAELSTGDARRRLHTAVSRLLGALAGPDRPLVLALDDLHHADTASLELLRYLLVESGRRYLLIVAAYRVEEARHRAPLATLLADLGWIRLTSAIDVGPLSEPALAEALAETLRCSADLAGPLAAVVAAKTGANPLFVGQFLHRMRERRLLAFEPRLPGWTWNLDAIAQEPVTDNVVDLVAGRIDVLPAEVRRVLDDAALLGEHFDAVTLSQVSGLPLPALIGTLHRAIQERLVQPIDTLAAPGDHTGAPARGRALYRWQHDRIRHTVWSRVPADQLPARRLAIGRALLAGSGDREEALFDVVGHLNAAAALLCNEAERVDLARLNLAAAGRAARAGAHEAALGHADAGLRLLPGHAWVSRYDLALQLHLEAARMAAVTGDRVRAEELFDAAYANAPTDLDRVGVLRLRLRVAIDQGNHDGHSLELGLRGLSLLGYEVPEDPAASADAALTELRTRLADLQVADVAEAPQMTDPAALAAAGFLSELLAVLLPNPDLLALVTAKGVELTLTHGLSDASATFFAYHSAVSANRLDDDTARWSGRLAVRLIDRLLADESTPRLYGAACIVVCLTMPMWYDGPEPILALAQRTERRAAEQGDPFVVGYLRFLRGSCRLWIGAPLADVAAEIDRAWDAFNGSQLELGNVINRSIGGAVAALRGVPSRAAPPPTPTEEALAELALNGAMGWISAPVMNDAALVAYHDGDYEQTLALAGMASAMPAISGTIWYAEMAFYHALSLTARYTVADADRRLAWARLDELQAAFDRWSRSCPVLAAHKALLVSAERARLGGDVELAIARYDQAIGTACEHGFSHVEAIAAELAARYAQQRGDHADAANYLHRAAACYERWGAHAKVARLEDAAAALGLESVGGRRAAGHPAR